MSLKWIQSLVLLLSTPVFPMNDTPTTSRSRPPVNGDMVLAPKKGVPIPPTDPRLHSIGQGSYYILPPTSASPVSNYATHSPPPTTTTTPTSGFVYNPYGTFAQGILAPPPPSSYNFQTEHATSIPIASGPIIAPPTVKHVHGFQNVGDGRVETHNIDLRYDASMTNAANVGQSPGMRGRHSDNRAKHVGIQQTMSGDRQPVPRTALQRDNAEIYSKPTKNREPNAKCSFSVKPSSELKPSSAPFEYTQKMKEAFENSVAKLVFELFLDQDDSLRHAGSEGSNTTPGLKVRHQILPTTRFVTPSTDITKPLHSFSSKRRGLTGFSPGVFDDDRIHNMFQNIDTHATQRFDNPKVPDFPDNQFQPGQTFNFGFGFGSAKNKKNPFHGNPFAEEPFHFARKRRMAGFENSLSSKPVQKVCAPTSKSTLISFSKYGGQCVLWAPHKQNINFVTCSNESCRMCTNDNITSRCMAEELEMHVWVFCERGPMAEKVVLDTVKVPAYCTCEVLDCL